MTSHASVYAAFADRGAGWSDHLLPVVSQEVRTSLNVILGFVEMLADPGFNPGEREEFVRRIRIEGQILLDRVESSLASGARIESRGVPFQRMHRARRRRARGLHS